MMTRMMIAIAAVALLTTAACNNGETDSAATAGNGGGAPAATAASGTTAVPVVATDGAYQPLAGTALALDSGEEVTVLSVGEFDRRLGELSGLVAIEGRVSEAHPDLGALILVDCANMAGCGDGCCPQAEVAVRLAMSEYEGSLPATDSEVIVIGELTVLDAGFELAVREIRRGEEVLISRAA